MKDIPSPNFNARESGVALRYVVLHYTNMKTGAGALARMIDPGSEVSAHYMIDEDGAIYRLVPEEKRAWHAGKSFWRSERDMNSASIGIELANPGPAFGYRPFTKEQLASLKELLADIWKRYGFSPEALLAHSDIAPLRKEDPGELFPWREFAALGFGLWPNPLPEDYAPASSGESFALLRQIGYDAPEEDEEERLAALRAFRRRYHPEHLMEEETAETLARLRALARMAST